MKKPVLALVVTLAAAAVAPGRAHAFGTMSHSTMTDAALRDAGFSTPASRAVQVFNFYVDFYEQLLGQANEHWYAELVGSLDGALDAAALADGLHFDGTTSLTNPQAVEAEWTRLSRATKHALRQRLANDDYLGALAVVGVSLHAVQDFYSHTNWAEPDGDVGEGPAAGPGWAQRGLYGNYPTWFDVPLATRLSVDVYGPDRGHRSHGDHQTDNNAGLITGMNKDVTARPYYTDAYIMASFATRQWVATLRTWVGDDNAWNQLIGYNSVQALINIAYEDGMRDLSIFTPGWDGCTSQSAATKEAYVAYRFDMPLLVFLHFDAQNAIEDLSDPNPAYTETPVASSEPFQRDLELVRTRMLYFKLGSNADLGAPGNIYATFVAHSTRFRSAIVDDENDFSFNAVCAPFTFVSASPRSQPRMSFALDLWDSDYYPGGNDDHLDLAPDFPWLDGERTVHMWLEKHTGWLGGDTAGAGYFFQVWGGGSSNPAGIGAAFDTFVPNPPLSTFSAVTSAVL